MEVKIDLSGLVDEENGGDVNEAIKDLIVNSVIEKIYQNVDRQINEKIASVLEKGINARLVVALDSIIQDLLNYEFTPVSRYGEEGKPTTLKNRIFSDIEKAMVWRDGSYDSDKSPYTKAVRNAVDKKLEAFAKEFHKDIDTRFVADCMEYARKKLQERLGIK